MKKICSLFLSAAMVLCLAACSGTQTGGASNLSGEVADGGLSSETPSAVTVTGKDALGEDIEVKVSHDP